jgi:hypothetical protein
VHLLLWLPADTGAWMQKAGRPAPVEGRELPGLPAGIEERLLA